MRRLHLGLLLLLAATPAHADRDVAALLMSLPGVADGIAGLCDEACAGNERRSWLERAVLDDQGVLRLELRLRSRHVPVAGVVLYDNTAHVTATARVQLLSCAVSDWDVTSNNDLYDIALRLFRDRIGAEIAALEDRCREAFGT